MNDLDCQDLVELVTGYLDDALDPQEARRVSEHLATCDGCAAYVEQAQLTIGALRRLDPDPVDPDTADKVLAALRKLPAEPV